MAKLNLEEQIRSTRYGQSDDEDFEDFFARPSLTTSGRIVMLPIEQLVEYKDEMFEKITGRPQPFHPCSQEKILAMSKSIAVHGVIDPIIVRPIEGNKYQIIAGRNRARASALCNKKEIPAIIRTDIDDISAAMIMLDTNLEQRHNLCYSEKAYAYKMRVELQRQQGRRTDLEENIEKVDTLKEAGREHKDSRRTVAYLIRLTFLIPDLLLLVDSGKIGFKVAVNVSYLTVETQEYLVKSIIPSGIKLKSEQISELRRLEDCGSLNPKMIQSVFCSKTKLIPGSITISGKKLMEYADILATTDNIEFLFFEFLKEYRKSVQRT